MSTVFSNVLNSDVLFNLGFERIGEWVCELDVLDYALEEKSKARVDVLCTVDNALYAFVQHETVLYIGKTTRSIKKRFLGYRKPGASQSTNLRCNAKLKEKLKAGSKIDILVFTPVTHLRYADFEINLAAGLEDALIQKFNPPWNGRDRGHVISEEAEREEAEAASVNNGLQVNDAGASYEAVQSVASFEVKLHGTYYEKGLINVGVAASPYLGGHDEPVEIAFSDGSPSIISSINRTAVSSGSVRIVGRNGLIADWFQKNFKRGDTVQARILDTNHIILLKQ